MLLSVDIRTAGGWRHVNHKRAGERLESEMLVQSHLRCCALETTAKYISSLWLWFSQDVGYFVLYIAGMLRRSETLPTVHIGYQRVVCNSVKHRVSFFCVTKCDLSIITWQMSQINLLTAKRAEWHVSVASGCNTPFPHATKTWAL